METKSITPSKVALRYVISTLTENGKLLTPRKLRTKIESKPDWYIEKVLGYEYWAGVKTTVEEGKHYYWEKQLQIIRSIRDNARTIAIGCTGSTKTFAAAIAMCWWLSAYEKGRVFTIAPTYRQVEMNLWGYVGKLKREALIALGGKLGASASWEIDKECYAKGFSVKQPENVAGIHGSRDLLIVDDAHAIPRAVTDAMERAAAGGTLSLLLLANPLVITGEVYDAFHRGQNLYNKIKIPAWVCPNYQVEEAFAKEKAQGLLKTSAKFKKKLEFKKKLVFPLPGAIIKSKCDEWKLKYGAESNFYKVMVCSEFPTQEPNTLIPLDWLTQATTRELPINQKLDKHIVIGVDVSRFGDYRTVFSPVRGGRQVLKQIEYAKRDTLEVA